MASRRLLTSVAVGTAGVFVSRNNDVDGWWALGLLLETLPAGDPDYRVDLLAGDATPRPAERQLGALGRASADYFAWSLGRHGVPTAFVRSATLTLRFDRASRVRSHLWEPTGRLLDHAFVCRVEVEDDRGRVSVGEVRGHCGRRVDFTDPNRLAQPQRSVSRGLRIRERVFRRTIRALTTHLRTASDRVGHRS